MAGCSNGDEASQPAVRAPWLSAVSHDLREPMNAILGMTRLLLETDLDDAQRRYAEIVEDAAAGMMSLINDLTDIGRLERDDIPIRRELFDLHRLLHGTLDVVRPRAAEPAVALTLDLAPSVPRWVEGDAGRLRQILVNLLANALKFTAEGEVTLAVEAAGEGHLAFAVRDTGPGLAAADRARIFEPYVQLNAGARGSVGLGLAIARRLVDRLGGAIALDSRPGEGATFTVTLPLAAADAPPSARRASLDGCRVLVVDADTPLRARLCRTLEAFGAKPSVREDAEAATAAIAAGRLVAEVALVVATEPSPAATALAATLRGTRAEAVALALAPTGLRGAPERWRQAGFAGYLPYPVGADPLADALGLLLAAEPEARPFVTEPGLRDRLRADRHVLAVDDNPLNGRLVRLLLQRAGHRVSLVEDGEQAVARVKEGDVEAVLMDVQMPGIDGLEATRRIRRLEGGVGAVPIIAVTANAGDAQIAACREAGMDAVVTKPVDRTTLLDALDRALGSVPATG